jgi:hypothetical protein
MLPLMQTSLIAWEVKAVPWSVIRRLGVPKVLMTSLKQFYSVSTLSTLYRVNEDEFVDASMIVRM